MVESENYISSFTLCFFIWFLAVGIQSRTVANESKTSINVGVILDKNSPIVSMADLYMSMAISDFYEKHSEYNTRLLLHRRHSDDDVGATSTALELMNKEEVIAIIGPQTSSQAKFVINLGKKFQIPIISCSASSPFLSPTQNPYFIRTSQDDSYQVEAIAAIVGAYGWHEVVLIYEDTEYGNGLIPYITDAFQNINTKVPYRSVISTNSSDLDIFKELHRLKGNSTRVFLVHMNAILGSRLFLLAKDAGMMSEGYAWIITEGLSSLLENMEGNVIGSMNGVLGVRPYIPKSKNLENFRKKWKVSKLNPFGLVAYDTIWALAKAVEIVGLKYSNVQNANFSCNSSCFSSIKVSEMGPRLLNILVLTRFNGLSGEFHLVNGEMKPSSLEIINVVKRKEIMVIGYWTRECGIKQEPGKVACSNSRNQLENTTWPGNTKQPPKGWVVPSNGKKLRIGVPASTSFEEFVKFKWNPRTKKSSISGFPFDVFRAVLKALPISVPYTFVPYMNSSGQSAGNYDALLYQIKLQKFDAAVADITIVANRSLYVDFTLPYTESGVSMLVKIKDDERKNIWIFLKPLTWDLWLTTGAAILLTGFAVWVLEHRINAEFRGSIEQQLGTILSFAFSTLVFAHREKVLNNWSRFVLIIWVFVVLIVTQSYTASLASILTVQRLQPTFKNVQELRKDGRFVGYQIDSFTREFLIQQLGFDVSKLKPLSSPEEYHDALSKGGKNGGVDAIFDELPYIKLFLAKYCSRYRMVGPRYKTDGFGFAFPQGSPLVPYFSRAILNITQDTNKMEAIERKYFSSQTCQDDQDDYSTENMSLSLSSFGGLFIISGLATICSCVIYIARFCYNHQRSLNTIHPESSLWSRIVVLTKHFDEKDINIHSGESEEGVESSVTGGNLESVSLEIEDDCIYKDGDGDEENTHNAHSR